MVATNLTNTFRFEQPCAEHVVDQLNIGLSRASPSHIDQSCGGCSVDVNCVNDLDVMTNQEVERASAPHHAPLSLRCITCLIREHRQKKTFLCMFA